jgi:hypothetical protein
LSVEADGDGIVKGWTPDLAGALVDVADGFGKAMVDVELLGVVNDGLVLPVELRCVTNEDRGGVGVQVAAADADGRRKEQQRAAARKYRKRKKVTGSKPRQAAKSWRSLGMVGAQEVRVFEGPHGPYAMLLNATIDGEPIRKVTTSDKSWRLESVTLADALPGLVSKWKAYHDAELKTWDAAKRRKLVPSFEDFSVAAAKAVAISQLERGSAHAATAQNDDASARHGDASSSVIISSSSTPAADERNAQAGRDLGAVDASSSRHDDALSSMSSKSSSLREEEMQRYRPTATPAAGRRRSRRRQVRVPAADGRRGQTATGVGKRAPEGSAGPVGRELLSCPGRPAGPGHRHAQS